MSTLQYFLHNSPNITGLADNDIDLSDVTTIASSTTEELGELGDAGEGEGEGEGDKYQAVKSQLKTFLQKSPDHQQQKPSRTRLIDNVNSYL